MMKLGVCGSAQKAAWAKESGCDYIELNFTSVAEMDEQEFAEAQQLLQSAGLAAEAMNCFLPQRFPIMTLEDTSELEAFMRRGFERAQALGTKVVVFGSAKARVRPESIPKEDGITRLAPIFRLAGGIAAEHGIRIAIEPLNYRECNVVNTLRDGMTLAKAADHEGVALLADMYHMGENDENFDDILDAGEILIHCHIGRPAGRKYPMPGDGYDYAPFFAALRKINYPGRLSVEAGAPNGPEDLAVSINYLRGLCE